MHETVIAAQEATPSLLGATLRIVAMTGAIAAAAWAWYHWQRKVKGPTKRLEILDRTFLARGASVALLRVDDRRLLIGVSAEGVRLIRDLDLPGPAAETGFAELLAETVTQHEAAS